MTTPERLRRRQRFEGVGLAFLGVMVVASSCISDSRDDAQDRSDAASDQEFRTCIVKQVKGIGKYLDARSETTEGTTTATKKVITSIASAFPAEDASLIAKALNQYIVDQNKVDLARDAATLPQFPNGECEAGS